MLVPPDAHAAQKNFLPHKTVSQIISYYYNIWKIR